VRKERALLSSLVIVWVCGVLSGQDAPRQPTSFLDNAALQGQSKTSFPSSPELRSKAKIQLVRQGCLGACPQYSLTVFGNGRVVYEGREAVRVKGRAEVKLSEKAVDDLMLKINEMDFFGYQPRPGTSCVTDGPTATITVSEPGRQKRIADECIEGREIEELEAEVDKAVHIQRWVFIDAKELQNQIDRGWDITMHGREYARQAVEWDDPEVLRVLLRNGVSVETVAYDGESLLQRAVTANRYASVKTLLELGANPRALNSDGWGPAQNAGNRSIEMCKLFLAHGAGIDDQDGMGETMLMNASGSPANFEIVKFLVSSGANLNLRNQAGETAIGKAQRMRQQFQGSIDSTFNPNYPRFFGDPEIARASYAATQRQYEKVIEYLRQHGGNE
jgi:hypothetical protein